MMLTVAPSPFILALIAAVLSIGAVRLVEAWLRARAVLDHPNARSSHAVPTPRGAGLAVMAVALPLLAWDAVSLPLENGGGTPWVLIVGALGLAALSWLDDLRNLSARVRLVAHFAACLLTLLVLPLPGPVFQGWLPPSLDLLAAAVCWVWFVNLFNFMDGIDGISGVQTVALGAALALLHGVANVPIPVGAPWILAGAMAGFLVWNWHPARIFLGDVGSVPLGFLLGGLLVMLASLGHLAAALIAPAYYLADATLTLANRIIRRRPFMQAHREHAYQRAVQAGVSHARVSGAIALLNAALAGLALWAAVASPWAPLILAAVLTGGLLWVFQHRARWLAPKR
ncbi:MraY family glycosyltransferase [Rhodospira trueperi]|uniref:UDP-N-acetylmuramyl pentapeptide phosphotransferase/UDP-N-acetylglucosamine-1-phosphate transferase n=1 Tax=Rhodospira trueperi TaxID=69960 RepID=A0A1G6XJA0_9PROT|nr:glycosyltransferase family 4 protein [Rhodospira trueperi]SDD78278.1 UDP-N-acetylmuramyl pentapeptide phosphotransferase/UDP-N-acetylglucosamine-1-phosphate transferase [Rhodospira trueperi]